jgi:hypothetical protein
MHFGNVDLKIVFTAILFVSLSLSSNNKMCGDENCNLYDTANFMHEASRAAPPDDGWSGQREGLIPPGSLNIHSKREMFGGSMYGAFGSEGTDQRLHTEDTLEFSYRDIPSETGRVFLLPNGVGPPSDGHYLLLNFHSTSTSQMNRKMFDGNTDAMFSSSGLSMRDQSAQLMSDPLQDSSSATHESERQFVRAGINPVTGIDCSDGDDSAPGFIGNYLLYTEVDLNLLG